MKTIKRLGAIILLSIGVLAFANMSSCSDKGMENSMTIIDETIDTKGFEAKYESQIKQYDFYGQEHNRVLEGFFTELADKGYNNVADIRNNKSEVITIVTESAEKLLRSYQYLLEEKSSTLEADKIISQVIEKIKKPRTLPKSLTDDSGYIFSPKQKEMLAMVDNVLYKYRTPKEVFDEMNKATQKAIEVLPERELEAVLVASSVAKYSNQFWYDYFGLDSQIKTRVDPDWIQILEFVVTDALAAVEMIIALPILSSIFPEAVAIYAGAISLISVIV